MHQFLDAERVRIPAKKKDCAVLVPQSAPPEQIQKYENDQTDGPDKVAILIAWNMPLSSACPWNEDMLTLLAEKARQLLTASKTTYNESWLELPELMKQITNSLRETKRIINKSSNSVVIARRQRRRA